MPYRKRSNSQENVLSWFSPSVRKGIGVGAILFSLFALTILSVMSVGKIYGESPATESWELILAFLAISLAIGSWGYAFFVGSLPSWILKTVTAALVGIAVLAWQAAYFLIQHPPFDRPINLHFDIVAAIAALIVLASIASAIGLAKKVYPKKDLLAQIDRTTRISLGILLAAIVLNYSVGLWLRYSDLLSYGELYWPMFLDFVLSQIAEVLAPIGIAYLAYRLFLGTAGTHFRKAIGIAALPILASAMDNAYFYLHAEVRDLLWVGFYALFSVIALSAEFELFTRVPSKN